MTVAKTCFTLADALLGIETICNTTLGTRAACFTLADALLGIETNPLVWNWHIEAVSLWLMPF